MIIETHDLSCRRSGRDLVEGVSLSVPQGAAMVLLGGNGAGKTSLLRVILNVLSPSAGSARVLGCDSRSLGPSELACIGHVAEASVLPARLTIARFLDYLRPLYPRWDRTLERRLCDRFALPVRQAIGQLSHGETMKLKLVSALAFRPELLVVDELLGGLDPAVRDDILSGLIERAEQTSILLATHEIAEIERLATHVAFMRSGKLAFCEENEQLAARHREVRAVLAATIEIPPSLPATWLCPAISGHVLQFIDCDFEGEDAVADRLARLGLATEKIESFPLSLREIAVSHLRTCGGETLA